MSTFISKPSDKRLVLLELGTLLVLSILTLWSVRALLEEWGLFGAFNALGPGYMWTMAGNIPLRPLHLLAPDLYWLLTHGRPSGVPIGTLLLLLVRYVVVRWAVSPLFQGYDRWILASLAAALVAWPGAWLGRFAPALFSTVFFFLAMGLAIRLHRQWSLPAAVGCVASIMVLLCTYQGLALCIVALPLFALLWPRTDQTGTGLSPGIITRAEIRIALTIAVAFLTYGVYALVVSHGANGGGYEAGLAENSGRLLTIDGISTHIGRAYLTVFGTIPTLFPLLLLLAFYLCAVQRSSVEATVPAPVRALLIVGLVAALPLFSLIYVSAGHIGDPDRLMYPVSVAFVLVVMSLMAWRQAAGPKTEDRSRAAMVVGILLAASVMMAYHVKKYANIQRDVITQSIAAIDAHHPASLLIQDATGKLGDVYTLLETTLSQALAVHGRPVNAVICTLSAVDRIHPDAQRYPIPTTPRCENAPAQAAPVLVLVAREENGRITLRP